MGSTGEATSGILEIRARIKDYVARELTRDHRDVDLDTESLVDTGILDSLSVLKLLEFLDDELGVKVPDEELLPEDFDTLDTIARLVAAKLGVR